MKIALAVALGGALGMGSDDSRERPVDRVGAAGWSGRTVGMSERGSHEMRLAKLASLGVDLIAYKFGRRQLSGPAAESKLVAILAWPHWWTGGKYSLTDAEADAVALWSIHEWVEDKCAPRPHGCGGAREVPAEQGIDGAQRMILCSQCNGTGKRRWKDEERMGAMGKAFPDAMDKAHQIIAEAEALATRRCRELLERW